MNVITITKSRSLQGQYTVSIKRTGKAGSYPYSVHGAGEAAAQAAQLASDCEGPYQILGDASVLSGGIIGDSST